MLCRKETQPTKTVAWDQGRPVARIFRRGVTWMSVVYVYIHKHAGLGACSPRKLLEVKCSDIASWVIRGQKQSRNSYIAHRVLHGCPYIHLLSHLICIFLLFECVMMENKLLLLILCMHFGGVAGSADKDC